jgi:hypothetical protein
MEFKIKNNTSNSDGKDSCQIQDSNPLDSALRDLLLKSRTVAIVGLSGNPDHDSY